MTTRAHEIRERKYGPEGYTAMDAVEGIAKRMREITGSVFITIGRDRIESYALALDEAARILARVEVLENALEEAVEISTLMARRERPTEGRITWEVLRDKFRTALEQPDED